jgi:replication factor A1
MQCLQLKTLETKQGAPGGGVQRYRIILSDMRNYVQCMLATQANHVVHSGQLDRGSIVRLKQYQAQSLKGKKLVVPFPSPPRCVVAYRL